MSSWALGVPSRSLLTADPDGERCARPGPSALQLPSAVPPRLPMAFPAGQSWGWRQNFEIQEVVTHSHWVVGAGVSLVFSW